MTSGDAWPEVPPEIPPPWRPDAPDEPGPAPSPPIPVVPPPRPRRRDRDPGADVFERLLAHRIVVVSGRLTDELATRAAAQLMTLNAEGDGPVTLQLNCPDGDLGAAFALADTVALMTVPVTAECRGSLGGPALAVFAAADRRTCSAHASFRFHEPHSSLSGRAQEIEAQAEALRAQVHRLVVGIAEASGRPAEQVADDLRSGRFLDAEEAVAYGLVHEISRAGRDAGADAGRGRG